MKKANQKIKIEKQPVNISDNSLEKQMVQAISTNLRALRKEKNWSQADLAEKTGVHVTYVSRVELGAYLPNLEFTVKAAQTFGVSLESIVFPSENELKDVEIEKLAMSERLRLLESLDKHQRDAIITVIDSILTNYRIRKVLDQQQLAS